MAELPLHLKKLESLPGALDILRYLHDRPDHTADEDDICDDLDMSTRRFNKAKRRLVTTLYMNMRSDGIYELSNKGMEAGEELVAYDGVTASLVDDSKVNRRLVLVLPRTLVAGQPATMQYGVEPDVAGNFQNPANLVMRFQTIHADLSSDGDEMTELNNSAFVDTMEITPHPYSKARLSVQVYQLAGGGENLAECGGMYVDLFIEEEENPNNPLVAYGIDLELDPAM
ncbi:MAG: hypothetical protein ACPG7F_16360 [Aggregatilineales bacterium]